VGLALLLARWDANDRARSRAVGDATAVARQFASDDLSRSAFRWPRPAGAAGRDLPPFLDLFFTPTVAAHDPAKVVLYSRQGIVTYASDHQLIGTRAADARRVRAALEHPQYDVAHGLQYAYVPGMSDYGPQKARGVMRLERDYAPIAAEIHDEFLSQAITIALALVALYLAMLPIMRRVTSSLRRSYVERAELAAIVDYSNDAIIGLSVRRADHVVERRRAERLRLALGRGRRRAHRLPVSRARRARRHVGARLLAHDKREEGRNERRRVGDDVADSRRERRARRLLDHRA